ncbi:hypothetical protein DAC15_129 [Bacteroides phage DAC15]|jgi:hypothetical protein|nr:hypothetical protein KNU90_gp012 [Bacteroides phage DAC15]QIN96306.1 hypothetical protein DAC15_129 [Bacteroides phage DAC15]QIN96423.1 hypothetical protein DAC17_126 [Bacteroides phage DAC17]
MEGYIIAVVIVTVLGFWFTAKEEKNWRDRQK